MVEPTPPRRGGRPSPPPRRLPAAARREAILEAALPLFALRGAEGTTTRQLAAAAGVTEPVLYRHFRSKAALFVAVLERVERRLLAYLRQAVAGTADAAGRLRALADRLPRLLSDLEDELRVVNGAAATHAEPATRSALRATLTSLAKFLSEAIATADLRPDVDAEAAGHLLLELGLGASLVAPFDLPGVRREDFASSTVGILLRGLTARGRPPSPPRR
jgi:AcrR family transcriptional regulator